jgi:hypothetical protein
MLKLVRGRIEYCLSGLKLSNLALKLFGSFLSPTLPAVLLLRFTGLTDTC